MRRSYKTFGQMKIIYMLKKLRFFTQSVFASAKGRLDTDTE